MVQTKLAQLVQQTKSAMQSLCYSDETIRMASLIFNEFIEYVTKAGEDEFSEELGDSFLSERYNCSYECKVRELPYKTAAALRAIRKLSEYKAYGGFYRVRRTNDSLEWAMNDTSVIKAFIGSMANADTAEQTKKTNLYRIQKFYDFLRSTGTTSVEEVKAEILSAYALSMHGDSKRYAQDKINTLRHYLRYLYNHGYVKIDFSKALPRISAPRNKNIPAIWSNEDVEKLLKNVDRSSPVGRRDYAIFLLTTELGLRASDISDLKLSNLNWTRKEIEVSQHKTKKINVCPMTDDAGWGLIDYIRHGRPKSDLPYVFLTATAPYTKLGSTAAVGSLKRHMQSCGIHESTKGVSKGMHALRHSLARKLLDQNVPLELISDVMGHTQITSSSPYLKVDIEGLRQCTLSLKEVEQYVATSKS